MFHDGANPSFPRAIPHAMLIIDSLLQVLIFGPQMGPQMDPKMDPQRDRKWLPQMDPKRDRKRIPKKGHSRLATETVIRKLELETLEFELDRRT